MPIKRALLVGLSEYADSTLPKLTAPLEDVRALAKLLKRPDIGAFDEVDALVNSSLSVVQRKIAQLCDGRSKDDLILLYFSGHGILDFSGDLFFALADTVVKELYATALNSHYIRDVLNKSRSRRQILILDCCHSGAYAAGVKGTLGAAAITRNTFEVDGYGREILASNAATQFAWEGNSILGSTDRSLFTHFLVEGLESGFAGSPQSNVITVEQAYRYAHDKVVREQPFMRPQRWSDRQEGVLIIAKRRVSQNVGMPEPTADECASTRKEGTLSGNSPTIKQSVNTVKDRHAAHPSVRTRKVFVRIVVLATIVGVAYYGYISLIQPYQETSAARALKDKQFDKFVQIEYCDYVREQVGSRTDASLQVTIFNGSGFDCEPKDRCDGHCLCSGPGIRFELPPPFISFYDSGQHLLHRSASWGSDEHANILSSNPPRIWPIWTVRDVPKGFTAIKVELNEKIEQICDERTKLDRWNFK